ncbi:Threonylcarbamoyl-AMP synthase [Apilactobacillus kunkeei]|nr:Threonylcarbamoyl-AMP synthase [Apilactobacillus kunkeei]
MDTKIYTADDLSDAAKDIADGKLVSFPTETVYGLGADATNEDAVKQVYAAKGRPSDNPLIVHVDGPEMVERYAQPLSDEAKKLINTFWPGPLTIIFNLKDNVLSKTVTGGLDTAAFRNPNNDVTLSLIRETGVPIVGPSANTSLGTQSGEKANLIVAVSDEKVKDGMKAGDIIKSISKEINGGGGGRPNMAQAGGSKPEGLPKAMEAAVAWLENF